MYYIMKDIRITEDEKVYLTCADSNIYPRRFYDAKYAADEKDLQKKLSLLFESILEGNIHPEGSKVSYINDAVKTARAYMEKYAPVTNVNDDRRYGTNRAGQLNKLISETIGYIAVESPDNHVPYDRLKECLPAFDTETKKIYEEIENKFNEEEIYTVEAASMSQVFPGYDILFRAENNECIVCRRENYDNHGHLSDKDHTAIFLGEDSGDAFYCLCDTVGSEPSGMEINWRTLSGIYMARLPYEGFDPDRYGMCITDELREELMAKKKEKEIPPHPAARKGNAR